MFRTSWLYQKPMSSDVLRVITGLIGKLISASAVVRNEKDLSFSFSFTSHMKIYSNQNPGTVRTFQEWRYMLGSYSQSLAALSNDELAALILFFEWFYNPVETTAIASFTGGI
jgi:hypothetical protein